MRQTSAGLILDIIKNRNGEAGSKLLYNWNIDKGYLEYIPTLGDAASTETRTMVQEKTINQMTTQTINNPF